MEWSTRFCVTPPLRGARLLLVEDDALLLMELEAILLDAGAEMAGCCRTVRDALAVASSEGIDAAILDVRVGRETIAPVAQRLASRGTPFIFYTAVEHVAAIVDRRVGHDLHVPRVGIDLDLGNMHAVGEGQRRIGADLGVESSAIWPRAFSSAARAASSVSAMRRSVPTTPKFPSAYAMSVSDASSSSAAMRLPFSSITSMHFTREAPAVIAEREPTEA
jgi:CheY-like chemotaxis protein